MSWKNAAPGNIDEPFFYRASCCVKLLDLASRLLHVRSRCWLLHLVLHLLLGSLLRLMRKSPRQAISPTHPDNHLDHLYRVEQGINCEKKNLKTRLCCASLASSSLLPSTSPELPKSPQSSSRVSFLISGPITVSSFTAAIWHDPRIMDGLPLLKSQKPRNASMTSGCARHMLKSQSSI